LGFIGRRWLFEVAAFDDGDGGGVDVGLEGGVDLLGSEGGNGGFKFWRPRAGFGPMLSSTQLIGDGGFFGAGDRALIEPRLFWLWLLRRR